MKKTKDEKELVVWVDKDNFYLYQGDVQFCEGCKEILKTKFVYVRHWVSKKEHHFYSLCQSCLDNKFHKKLPIIFITMNEVKRVSYVLKDCELAIFPNPKDMIPMKDRLGEISTTDSVYMPDGSKLIDRTKYADTQSLKGAKIGKEIEEVVSEKDKLLSVDEGLAILDNAVKDKPMIELNEKKQIEQTKEENK